MDGFFNKKRCDRCGAPLNGGFTMSRFNTDAICMKCAEEERQHPDYQLAADAELAAVRSGNLPHFYRFPTRIHLRPAVWAVRVRRQARWALGARKRFAGP